MTSATPQLRLYDTLTREKRPFTPLDPANVRVYVCGPTVYDYAHIGNARPVIVFDLLYRLLRHLYPGEGNASDGSRITYVRNITDVDDKINARAARDYPGLPLNDAIGKVTEKTAGQFEADARALGCLTPTVEPRATENIDEMIALIAALIQKGHAYEAGGEVLFSVPSMPDYGQLSGRDLENNVAGARVAVEAHKRNPADFVLWKLSSADEPGWESPWGRGRPGWHIECSAMSERYLGQVFDIHGGGLDLIFPHHENEIAQSRCAHGTQQMAQVWMHNGFLQVEGQKMSKSLGNFVTIHDLLATEKFGGRKWPGEVLRLAMLMTHYREPIDFSVKRLEEAERKLQTWREFAAGRTYRSSSTHIFDRFVSLLSEDLNTSAAISYVDEICSRKDERKGHRMVVYRIIKFLGFTGLKTQVDKTKSEVQRAVNALERIPAYGWSDLFYSVANRPFFPSGKLKPETALIALLERISSDFERRKPAGFKLSEKARQALAYSVGNDNGEDEEEGIKREIDRRLSAISSKKFEIADEIRADLRSRGVELTDYKDPETGERRTKWEVKR